MLTTSIHSDFTYAAGRFPFLIGRMLTHIDIDPDTMTISMFPFLIGRMLTLKVPIFVARQIMVSIPYR